MEEKEVKLTVNELNLILNILSKQQYGKVAFLINKIIEQTKSNSC